MFVNLRHEIRGRCGRAAAYAAIALTALTAPATIGAQTPTFLPLPGCVAPPPPPGSDGFPVANTDALQTASAPLAFTGATLLANDTGAVPLVIASIAATSTAGGQITGANPYTYTPPAGFLGVDSFTYRVANSVGSATGVVKVTVTADLVAPTVSLTSPTGGQVSGSVLVAANASDNVGVAGVSFFDGTTPIGAQDTSAPYSVTWNTSALANGPHTLTAVARDTTGHTTTSAAVTVTVSNQTQQSGQCSSVTLSQTTFYSGGPASNWRVIVTAPTSTCTWTATVDQPWLLLNDAPGPLTITGTGSGAINLSTTDNRTGAFRFGNFTIAGTSYKVTQEF